MKASDGDVLLCATVYEPDRLGLQALIRFFAESHCDTLIFDNSPSLATRRRVELACGREDVGYYSVGRNVGTAGALNYFLRAASETSRGWLVYLDQDSTPGSGFLEQTMLQLGAYPVRAALIGSQVDLDGVDIATAHRGLREAKFVIASGTAMRVEALIACGGFDESFFLDLVDHEMCLRVRVNGYGVYVDAARTIVHAIGTGAKPVLGGRMAVTRHPWWRRRQMWLNSIVLARRYWQSNPNEIARHMAGRICETVVAALAFGDARFVTTALGGLLDALRAKGSRAPDWEVVPKSEGT